MAMVIDFVASLSEGGPLIVERSDKRYEIMGIVSWGNGCARRDYPGVSIFDEDVMMTL
jgi:secreted trypsin-like serine protease